MQAQPVSGRLSTLGTVAQPPSLVDRTTKRRMTQDGFEALVTIDQYDLPCCNPYQVTQVMFKNRSRGVGNEGMPSGKKVGGQLASARCQGWA